MFHKTRSHLLIVLRLQINSLGQKVLQHAEDTISLQKTLQAPQELHQKLHFPPLPPSNALIRFLSCSRQHIRSKLAV